jgi:exonuclease III
MWFAGGPKKPLTIILQLIFVVIYVTDVCTGTSEARRPSAPWTDSNLAEGAVFRGNHIYTGNMDNITISCLNCNSLNMSDVSKINQNRKLLAITKLKSDIIMCSDIRLSNKNKISCSADLEKCFRTNPFGNYDFYHNLTKNKRGVGILVKKGLDAKLSRRRDDIDENYMLLELDIKNQNIVLGVIYGPNNNDPDFFTRLTADITSLGNRRLVLGGDWNATLLTEEVGLNIDILNMVNLPNIRHSLLIQDMCTEFDLLDPYRYKYPNKLKFTFVPRSAAQSNRSRIDFFLIHGSFTEQQIDCKIDLTTSSSMFDHRAITLTLNKKTRAKSNVVKIDSKILNDDIVEFIINVSIYEGYLIHISDNNLPLAKNRLL